jgi:hypothetical protein
VAVPPGATVCDGVDELTVKLGAGLPAPFSVTVCGEPLALSATETVAVKLAAEVGVKVTETVQLAPAASVSPQVLVSAKSLELVPAMEIPVIESVALPVFISVVDCAALVAPATAEKVSVAGESETPGAEGAVPVPLSATVCGVPLALSAMESDAAKLAAEAGVNVTETVQLAPAASELPHVLVSAKSVGFAPVMVMLVIVNAALPVFISVIVCAAVVVPAIVDAKVSVAGASDVAGAAAAVPVPFSVTVCVVVADSASDEASNRLLLAIGCIELGALSVTESVAVKLATESGVKVTEIVQLAPAASELPQVLVSANSVGLAPVIAMLEMASGASPVFISVAVCAAVVDPTVSLKVSVAGVSDAPGSGAAVPVPFSVVVCGEPVALSATDSVAE